MPQQIKVYSTPTCPWCKKVEQLLDDNHTSYQNLNVASDEAARDEMVSKTGKLAVPVVDIDGEISVGFDEKWLRENLNLAK